MGSKQSKLRKTDIAHNRTKNLKSKLPANGEINFKLRDLNFNIKGLSEKSIKHGNLTLSKQMRTIKVMVALFMCTVIIMVASIFYIILNTRNSADIALIIAISLVCMISMITQVRTIKINKLNFNRIILSMFLLDNEEVHLVTATNKLFVVRVYKGRIVNLKVIVDTQMKDNDIQINLDKMQIILSLITLDKVRNLKVEV